MTKQLSTPTTYRALVSKISKELTELDAFIRRRTAEGYWRIGKYIHEHLLDEKARAAYGESIYPLLAKDVDRDASTLQRIVQFYRDYPIVAPARQLTWGHYRSLITVKDKAERRKLEKEIIQKKWNTKDLRAYLARKRRVTIDIDAPIVQLKFTRGRLHTYQVVKANGPLAKISPLVLDLGFRLQYLVPGNGRYKEGDIVEVSPSPGPSRKGRGNCRKADAAKDDLFTYQARVDRIIDGDTLIVSLDFHLDFSISQKLRLRAIDCPEMDTGAGKKAKRFVESRLKDCEFIIVKTYKDRADKFDRYLADIFYAAGGGADYVYLNQELLDERLAVKYEI